LLNNAANENPGAPAGVGVEKQNVQILLVPVFADRFDRAALERFHALSDFLFGRRLFVHK